MRWLWAMALVACGSSSASSSDGGAKMEGGQTAMDAGGPVTCASDRASPDMACGSLAWSTSATATA